MGGPITQATISTHAPRTGSDDTCPQVVHKPQKFQPTLPARGATASSLLLRFTPRHFNPRSPHGERPSSLLLRFTPRHFNPRSPHGERRPAGARRTGLSRISTHAPRTGSDASSLLLRFTPRHFNPRSPHGERRPAGARRTGLSRISTHAPRTGSDDGSHQGRRNL